MVMMLADNYEFLICAKAELLSKVGILIPFLQIRKLKLMAIKQFAKKCTTRKW